MNSLTHLANLTSTSSRIRETLACDGGLERLVHLMRDFCLSPPPPDDLSVVFGLSPLTTPPTPPAPMLNPSIFDKHAAFRFCQALRCLFNVGVCGSELIRTRVVQAGTLDVIGCVLESWLLLKRFAVRPSESASGVSREANERRLHRRQEEIGQMQRGQTTELARLLASRRQSTDVVDAMVEVCGRSTMNHSSL